MRKSSPGVAFSTYERGTSVAKDTAAACLNYVALQDLILSVTLYILGLDPGMGARIVDRGLRTEARRDRGVRPPA